MKETAPKPNEKEARKQDKLTYQVPDTVKGSDKPAHAARSEAHQPNHADHWKKQPKRN